jgi:hypothetical protein
MKLRTTYALAIALLLHGCAMSSTHVWLHVSAVDRRAQVALAMDILNSAAGVEVFSWSSWIPVVPVEVRQVGYIGPGLVGLCTRSRSGVTVEILPRASVMHIAHELMHAAGLPHSPDPGNLMFRAPHAWGLTEGQLLELRARWRDG